jgi:hypothetical protein
LTALALGCTKPAEDDVVVAESPVAANALEDEASIEAKIVARKPVAPYPSATRVELHVQAETRTADGQSTWFPPRALTAEERKAVEATLSIPVYGDGSRTYSGCFIPHHFFRYFDAAGRQIGQIAVCFCCDGAAAAPRFAGEDEQLDADLAAIGPIIKGLGYRTDIDCH